MTDKQFITIIAVIALWGVINLAVTTVQAIIIQGILRRIR